MYMACSNACYREHSCYRSESCYKLSVGHVHCVYMYMRQDVYTYMRCTCAPALPVRSLLALARRARSLRWAALAPPLCAAVRNCSISHKPRSSRLCTAVPHATQRRLVTAAPRGSLTRRLPHARGTGARGTASSSLARSSLARSSKLGPLVLIIGLGPLVRRTRPVSLSPCP